MVDNLLRTISQIGWALFILYSVLLFIQTAWREDITTAVRSLWSWAMLTFLGLVILLSLLSAAVVFIEPTEIAVVQSVPSPGGIRPRPLQSGLQWIVPLLETEVRYPIYWQTYTMAAKPLEGAVVGDDSIRARTSDGQEVTLDCSIIFRIDEQQVVEFHIAWQDRYIHDFIRPTVRGYVRTRVSQFTVQEVNSSRRNDLENTLNEQFQGVFADKGLILDRFLIRDITFTKQYANAVEQKQVALEGEQQKEFEARQIVNLAEGEATAIVLRAEAQANALAKISNALKLDPDNLLTYQYIDKLAPDIQVMLLPNNAPFLFPLPTMSTPVPTNTITTTATTTAVIPLLQTPTPAPIGSGGVP